MLDEIIRVTSIHPLERNIFQIMISIQIGFVPRFITSKSSIICYSNDESSILMLEFNLDDRTVKHIQNHDKALDHTEAITGICSISGSGAADFASIGNDSTLRIWNHKNKLIRLHLRLSNSREIQFQEKLNALAIGNDRGDILVAIQNRIDLVKYSSCILLFLKTRSTTDKFAGKAYN